MDAIRKMVVDGGFGADTVITETLLSQQLGMSRTPIRSAMKVLEAEGLLAKRDGRGYTARRILEDELSDAFAVLGVLEGLAAHRLAISGLSQVAAERLDASLNATAAVVTRGVVDEEAIEAFAVANLIFHKTIMKAADNRFLNDCASRLDSLPSARLRATGGEDTPITRMLLAHSQHMLIRRAIDSGDSDRAFTLMREHSSHMHEHFDPGATQAKAV